MDPRITSAARYHQQKNYPAAEQIYRRVLLTEPKNIDALLLLGLLLHETSRNEEAIETLRRALKIQPHRAEVRQTLVGPLMALGRLAEAIVEARELARLRPLVAETHQVAAKLLLQAKDAISALPYAKRAAELQPKSPDIFVTLGRVYQQMNLTSDALAAVDRALALVPNHADALIDKAVLRQSQGQLDEAIALYEAGLRVAPKNVAALNNLGSCFLIKTRSGDAIRCFEAAAELSPTNPKPRNNVGAVLKELGCIDQAIPHFERALQLDPMYADGYCNIGACYATIGEHKLAIAASREALRVQPDYAEVGSNLLLSTLSSTDISAEEVFAEHVAWDRAHAAGLRNQLPAVAIDANPNRRIRIGYVSADFREHSVRYFIEPILAAHDRSQFEIVCYATGRRRDEVTDRLATLVDAWHFVAELTNQQLAELIRSHRIDILVDLAGHTSDHRLLTFARKPAPVQLTYLGYPTTTGLTAMDYRLTDSITDPPGSDRFYAEKLVRLPHAFFVYRDDPAAWFDPTLPVDRKGVFTFGSFNSFTKINDDTLDSWATILRGVPNSRLLMKARPLENPSTRQRVLGFFADHGVTADRLDLRAWVSLSEHTTMLGSAIDLMLDTFPYNGHTTSCQAIWRGVPVVTRSGDTFRSRVGECILRHLDLDDFVGRSKEEYEQKAIQIASDLPRLRELRPVLRDRMLRSPLCDALGFTRSLEQAYREIWRAKCESH